MAIGTKSLVMGVGQALGDFNNYQLQMKMQQEQMQRQFEFDKQKRALEQQYDLEMEKKKNEMNMENFMRMSQLGAPKVVHIGDRDYIQSLDKTGLYDLKQVSGRTVEEQMQINAANADDRMKQIMAQIVAAGGRADERTAAMIQGILLRGDMAAKETADKEAQASYRTWYSQQPKRGDYNQKDDMGNAVFNEEAYNEAKRLWKAAGHQQGFYDAANNKFTPPKMGAGYSAGGGVAAPAESASAQPGTGVYTQDVLKATAAEAKKKGYTESQFVELAKKNGVDNETARKAYRGK